jgi:hypothetical protein
VNFTSKDFGLEDLKRAERSERDLQLKSTGRCFLIGMKELKTFHFDSELSLYSHQVETRASFKNDKAIEKFGIL